MDDFILKKNINIFSSQNSANFSSYLQGMRLFIETKFEKESTNFAIFGQKNCANLLNFCDKNDNDYPIILIIPSIINKYCILDLHPYKSLINYLKKNKLNVFVIDWKEPSQNEINFSMDNYSEIIDQFINKIYDKYKKKITIFGYCLGGLFSIDACLKYQQDIIEKLVLLSVPWDFSPYQEIFSNLGYKFFKEDKKNILQNADKIPPIIIKQIFDLIDPLKSFEKYIKLSNMDKKSLEFEIFLAVENWVNDGISLTTKVAKTIFVDFFDDNLTILNQFKINEQIVDPSKINIPCLITISQKDRITPPSASYALANLIKNKKLIIEDTGHIGLVVGSLAESRFWRPLLNFII